MLAVLGLVTKISNLIILAFVQTNKMAIASILPLLFARFVPTGMRSMVSSYVKDNEQGIIFFINKKIFFGKKFD